MVDFTLRSLVSSLVMMMMLFSSQSSSSKVVDVNTICQRTKDPSFCSNLLNSKPGGAIGANLESLMEYTIDVIHGNISNSIDLIGKLVNKTGDQDVLGKFHYRHCLGRFICAKSDIEYTKNLLKTKKDYRMVTFEMYMVSFSVQLCLELPTEYNDPSMLPKYAEVVQQVHEIIGVILLGLLRG